MKEQLCKIDLPEIEGFEFGDVPEFRSLKKDDYFAYLDEEGWHCGKCGADDVDKFWILRKSQEWVTPTDEDAKGRPEVEVYDHEGDWDSCGMTFKLLFIDVDGRFWTKNQEGSVQDWRHCRMKKELR